MKTKYKVLLAAILPSLVGFSNGFNGSWSDCNSAAFSNCNAIFSVTNDSVFMTHYLEFNGQAFTEHGKGIIDGDSLRYHVWVTQQIQGWSTEGDHVLGLSKDSTQLKGYYKDNKGNVGPLIFNKR